jgi:hypothetical protein
MDGQPGRESVLDAFVVRADVGVTKLPQPFGEAFTAAALCVGGVRHDGCALVWHELGGLGVGVLHDEVECTGQMASVVRRRR